MKDKSFGNRLRELRGKRNAGEVAAQVECSQAALYLYESGKRTPDAIVAYRLAQLYGKTVEHLVAGKDPDPAAREMVEIEGQELVRVAVLEDAIAAGPGSAIDGSRIKEWIGVPAERLHRRHEYRALRITGDSMEPVLHKGDIVLVNTSRRDPRELKDHMVAAYLSDEELWTIKLLREGERGRSWILRALNPEYADREFPKKKEGFEVAAVEGMWLGGVVGEAKRMADKERGKNVCITKESRKPAGGRIAALPADSGGSENTGRE